MRKYKRRHTRIGKYKSPLEASIAKRLPKGRTLYEPEKLVYLLPKKYLPDFVVTTPSGKIYLEVKGYLRYEDQQKMRAVKFSNPELDIRFYFPKDQRVHLSQMTNSQWCKKYGFPYAIGRLPKGWFI